MLQKVLTSMPREEAEKHLSRCIDSGLWMPNAKEAAEQEAAAAAAGGDGAAAQSTGWGQEGSGVRAQRPNRPGEGGKGGRVKGPTAEGRELTADGFWRGGVEFTGGGNCKPTDLIYHTNGK